MSQANPQIGSNKSGLQYRTEDNDGKKALLNHHKGASAPTYAEAGAIWLSDAATPWLLKIYDGTDWITLGEVNATSNTFSAYTGTAALRLLNHASDTGSANVYAIAPTPAMTAYTTGLIVTLKPGNANTGASTINVNALGTKNIKTLTGTDPAAGMLGVNGTYQLVYDGTNFVLLNPSLGTAAYLDPGTTANKLVQLDGAAKLPAVDGSQLTNLPSGGSWVAIKTTTASNDSSVSFAHGVGGVVLDSTYKAYAVLIQTIVPSVDNVDMYMRSSTNAGSTWDSGASDYKTGASTASQAYINQTNGLGNNTGENFNATLYIYNPSNTTKHKIFGVQSFHLGQDANTTVGSVSISRQSTASVNGIQFYMGSGNISSGLFTLFGLKGS